MRMSWMIGALFVAVSAAPVVAQSPATAKELTPLEQTLIANEKSLIVAKTKDDGDFFKKTVSDDFAFVGPDGQLLQGREAIDNLGDSDLAELTPYDMKVVAAGDESAIVTYDAIVREKPKEDEGPQPRYQHFTSVWVKQGDTWKLKFQQTTPTHWGDW
jgi:ketosteroid isomerase-like protein